MKAEVGITVTLDIGEKKVVRHDGRNRPNRRMGNRRIGPPVGTRWPKGTP